MAFDEQRERPAEDRPRTSAEQQAYEIYGIATPFRRAALAQIESMDAELIGFCPETGASEKTNRMSAWRVNIGDIKRVPVIYNEKLRVIYAVLSEAQVRDRWFDGKPLTALERNLRDMTGEIPDMAELTRQITDGKARHIKKALANVPPMQVWEIKHGGMRIPVLYNETKQEIIMPLSKSKIEACGRPQPQRRKALPPYSRRRRDPAFRTTARTL